MSINQHMACGGRKSACEALRQHQTLRNPQLCGGGEGKRAFHLPVKSSKVDSIGWGNRDMEDMFLAVLALGV